MACADVDNRFRAAQWSFGIRLLVAAPGLLAALPLWAVGGYLLVTSVSDPSMAADEEFASIAALGMWVGTVAVVIGLYLAVAAVAVAGKRPGAVRLTLAAVALLAGALGVSYLLATGADAMPYGPLLAVQLYLATVALARLISRRRQDA